MSCELGHLVMLWSYYLPHDCVVAYASIDKPRLLTKYTLPDNPHLLALQFVLEKIDKWMGRDERVLLVADESSEHETPVKSLVADMQIWGSAIGSGQRLKHVIDTIHFVKSHENAGVQLADLTAYSLCRLVPNPRCEQTDKDGS